MGKTGSQPHSQRTVAVKATKPSSRGCGITVNLFLPKGLRVLLLRGQEGRTGAAKGQRVPRNPGPGCRGLESVQKHVRASALPF